MVAKRFHFGTMSFMATVTLKQVPEDLLQRLREDAERDRRSLNQQAIYLLERALAGKRPSLNDSLAELVRDAGPIPKGAHGAFRDVRSEDRGRRVRL